FYYHHGQYGLEGCPRLIDPSLTRKRQRKPDGVREKMSVTTVRGGPSKIAQTSATGLRASPVVKGVALGPHIESWEEKRRGELSLTLQARRLLEELLVMPAVLCRPDCFNGDVQPLIQPPDGLLDGPRNPGRNERWWLTRFSQERFHALGHKGLPPCGDMT